MSDSTPIDPTSTAQDAARIRSVASTYTALAAPLERQRVNVLTASAIVITQLPADQLKEFAGRSAEVCGRMDQLLDSLDAAGRALRDYAEALERSGEAAATQVGDSAPRSLLSGPPGDSPRLLPLDQVQSHVVGAEATAPAAQPEGSEAAAAHELSFLRDRAIDVLQAEISHWLPEPADEPYQHVRRSVPAAIAQSPRPAPVLRVRDEVIPVHLPAQNPR